MIKDLRIKPANNATYVSATYCTQGVVSLQNVDLDISETIVDNGALYGIINEDVGKTRIYATNKLNEKNGITIIVGAVATAGLIRCAGGVVQWSADIAISGDTHCANASIVCDSLGALRRTLSAFVNPGRMPQISVAGTITGHRYFARTNGIIDTQGGGPEFFPGSSEGNAASGGQYV